MPFLRTVVRSPDSDLMVNSSILSASTVNALSFLSASLAGRPLRFDEVEVGAERNEHDEQPTNERSPASYRLRHQVCTPPSRMNPGMISTVSQKMKRS